MKILRRITALAALALLASCGGGSSNEDPSFVCSVSSDKAWLREEMFDFYFWSGRSPDPSPETYADVNEYLDALRFQGDADEPRDRFSYIEGAAAFSQFFEEGKTLGYGVAVNGVEGTLPLRIRYIEPNSPAAAAGLLRGDTIVSANGTAAAQLVSSGDFSVLSAANEGDKLTLVVDSGSGARTVEVTAATFSLKPVTATTVFTLPNGKKAGYLSLKDFITQAEGPLSDAIAQIRAQGATELILDLRYNGGGRVSTATHLASLVTGATQAGKLFTSLVFNPKQQRYNTTYRLSSQPGTAFPRVVVLTGSRTCSASEMVANGLKPYADVVTIGGTSCGKPVGFSPQKHCDKVYSLVNFESLNANGQGKYYSGLPLTCTVKEDFTRALGDASETLTAAALSYLQNGSCPVQPSSVPSRVLRSTERPVVEPGQRSGMFAD